MNYLRREQGKHKVKKVLRVWRARTDYPEGLADDSPLAQRMLKTRVRCSSWCCGNPRKRGELTPQERRAQ